MKVGVESTAQRSGHGTQSVIPLSSRVRNLPWHRILFVTVLVAYIVLTLGVVVRSPLLTLDRDVIRLELRQRFPDYRGWINTYVMFGQRGPATLVALPWFVWRCWKSRSARPLIMLGTALVVLNLSVGVVKVATGRLGPRATSHVHAVFDGGDIYPSGHVSNAVVLYGLIAILAVSYRRTAAVAAVFLSLTVGLSTVYLDTHWLSDVFGGWLAGALVLLVLPWLMPYSERLVAWTLRLARRAVAGAARPVVPGRHRPDPVLVERAPVAARRIASSRNVDEQTTPAKV